MDIVRLQEFYGSYMDYRMLISKTNGVLYDVSLFCLVCPFNTQEHLRLTQVQPATDVQIHKIWKQLHSNHWRGQLIQCVFCFIPTPQYKIRKQSLYELLEDFFNVTMYHTGHTFHNYLLGKISMNSLFDASGVKVLYLREIYPSYVYVSVSLKSGEYKMITVIKKSTLWLSGWSSFYIPFHINVWTALGVSTLSITLLIISITFSHHSKNKLPNILLSQFGALTDHWNISSDMSLVNCIWLLWGTLSYSLTVLYGGEMASYLSVLSPPRYPTSIMDLAVMRVQVVSLGTFTYKGGYRSTFSAKLRNQWSIWMKKRRRGTGSIRYRIHFNLGVEMKLNQTFCSPFDYVFNLSNIHKPYSCRTNPSDIDYNEPITFVDSDMHHVAAKTAFSNMPSFWVSSPAPVHDLTQNLIIAVRKTYFAKLVVPVMSIWVSSGLYDFWDLRPLSQQIMSQSFQGDKNIPIESCSKSSMVNEFSPVKLESLYFVGLLTAICLTGCIFMFLIETMFTSKLLNVLSMLRHEIVSAMQWFKLGLGKIYVKFSLLFVFRLLRFKHKM